MFQKTLLKKILIMLPLGIVSATGVLFFWSGEATPRVEASVKDLAPVKLIKVANLSKIDWEIEIIEEWQLSQN